MVATHVACAGVSETPPGVVQLLAPCTRPKCTTHNADTDGWDGEPWPLSMEQCALLKRVLDEVRAHPEALELAEATGARINRSHVCRFLSGSRWRAEQGGRPIAEQIVDSLRWREKMGCGKILSNPEAFLKEAASGKLYVRGRDRLGRPIIRFHLARENTWDLEANVRYLVYTLERAIAAMGAEGLGRGQGHFCVLVDCSIEDRAKLPALETVRHAIATLLKHYPNRLGVLYLANMSVTVHALWKAVSYLVNTRTREKLVFVSGTPAEQLLVLQQHISPQVLGLDDNGILDLGGAFDAERYLLGGGEEEDQGHEELEQDTASSTASSSAWTL